MVFRRVQTGVVEWVPPVAPDSLAVHRSRVEHQDGPLAALFGEDSEHKVKNARAHWQGPDEAIRATAYRSSVPASVRVPGMGMPLVVRDDEVSEIFHEAC